ncbi:MAG: NAD(P)-dependent oxidoreductase, partial [Gemmatimonadaceae bacterium]|nr:NAD(P)-dependent oxidoreductase [Gemmatimonadaceae bacterium]
MNILITGGTGFISSHIVAALLAAGHEVSTLSRSGEFAVPLGEFQRSSNLRVVRGEITDRDLLSQEIPRADVVIHNASAVGAQGAQRLSGAYVDTNVGGANTIAHVLSNVPHSVKSVIIGSSISVYGEGNYTCAQCGIVRPLVRRAGTWRVENGWNPSCPVCAGKTLPSFTPETAARNGEHLYAITKKYQEDLLTLVANNCEIPLTIFRYATVYGPGQRAQNPYMQMIARLRDSKAPIIFEDGLQSRDFIEVSDVVRANMMVLNSTESAVKAFNIGSGAPRDMIDFVKQL